MGLESHYREEVRPVVCSPSSKSDRAAGAIKSGGTTRRAAKMVTLDLDHPDIEEYIGWKLSEEEKVSALVAGSVALQKHCNAVLGACWDGEELSLDPQNNAALKGAMIKAIQASVPQPHLQRMLDLAKHGWKSVEFDVMDTDWQGEAYGLYPVKTQTIQFGFLKSSWMQSSLVESGIYSSELKRKKQQMKGATLFLIAHLMQVNCGMISHILLGPVQTLESNLTQPSTSGTPVLKVGGSMVPTLAVNTCS